MTYSEMPGRLAEGSPLLAARIAGVLWLLVILSGMFAFVVGSSLMVRDDATATATNLLAHELLFRFSSVAELFAGLCYLGVTGLLYGLLKPVSRSTSLLGAFFGLGGVAIGGAAFLSRFAPLVLLASNQHPTAFSASQLQTMALMALKLYLVGFNMGMVFFGVQCFLVGRLIVRSTFLPRILGVLLAIGGSSYLISSFANLLAPYFGAQLLPFMAGAALAGEGSLTLWLIVKGVNVQRWKQQQSAAERAIGI